MAATKTKHNDTPNTPDVSESKIARMKVDELRRELKSRGVKGTADLKKPDLVKKLIKAEVAESRSAGRKTASGAKKTASASARKSSGKNPTSHNDTPNTPDVAESKIARMKVDELRRELKSRGVKGTAELKKPDLVKKLIKAEVSASGSKKSATAKKASPATKSSSTKSSTTKSSPAKSSTTKSSPAKSSSAKSSPAKSSAASSSGGKRLGKAASSSLKYSQEIRSTDDKPERAGRSLVTTDHEVIRQWAKARKAVPSTIAGTEHDGHLGVLRLDFPGYSGDRLTEVSWDDWFDAFDKRRLNFIYQQKQTSGKRSNFFQLENPDE